jgi:hypothetical protein
MSIRFPHLFTDDRKRFYFGQELVEAEEMFGMSAKQHPPELARVHPNHRIIETKELKLTFDAGKLSNMEFLKEFNFKMTLAPYAEEWKNLNDLGFGRNTTREEAAGYLSNWEKRASALGARKIEAGDDLASLEFSIYSSDERDLGLKTLGIDWNVFGINMGKSRRAGGGGLWTDGWIIHFVSAGDAESGKLHAGRIDSISAFCDEFNTAARK